MQATTKTLGLTINHLLSAIEQAKQEVMQLMQDPDLRTLNEDFRVGANMSLNDFVSIENEPADLKEKLSQLAMLAYVREIDPNLSKVDSQGRLWTAVVRENAHFRASVPGIKSVREALGMTITDANIVIGLYKAGLL